MEVLRPGPAAARPRAAACHRPAPPCPWWRGRGRGRARLLLAAASPPRLQAASHCRLAPWPAPPCLWWRGRCSHCWQRHHSGCRRPVPTAACRRWRPLRVHGGEAANCWQRCRLCGRRLHAAASRRWKRLRGGGDATGGAARSHDGGHQQARKNKRCGESLSHGFLIEGWMELLTVNRARFLYAVAGEIDRPVRQGKRAKGQLTRQQDSNWYVRVCKKQETRAGAL